MKYWYTSEHKKNTIKVLNPCSVGIVGWDGINPDPEKIEAILNMPNPTNMLSKFTTNLAKLTKPIRYLSIKNTACTCGSAKGEASHDTKIALTTRINNLAILLSK